MNLDLIVPCIAYAMADHVENIDYVYSAIYVMNLFSQGMILHSF